MSLWFVIQIKNYIWSPSHFQHRVLDTFGIAYAMKAIKVSFIILTRTFEDTYRWGWFPMTQQSDWRVRTFSPTPSMSREVRKAGSWISFQWSMIQTLCLYYEDPIRPPNGDGLESFQVHRTRCEERAHWVLREWHSQWVISPHLVLCISSIWMFLSYILL